jgi:hypothetical protein
MTITLSLSPEAEQRLREKAAANGQTVAAYLERLAEREAGSASGASPAPAAADFETTLDELSEGLPPLTSLPADFARADLYVEHD